MRKAKYAVLAAVLALACMLTAGCTTYDNFKNAFFSETGQAPDTIRIGVLEPQTGSDSVMGEKELRGIELANSLAPEVLGRKVELVHADTQSSIYVAESAVEDLMAKKPAAVLGSYGEAVTLTASRILGKAEIPAIAPTAVNPLITGNNDYYFRVTFTDAGQGEALADYTHHTLKQKKAAVVKLKNEDAATEMSSSFSERLVELTGDEDCTTVVEISADAEDFAPYAAELKESGIQTVFMPTSLKSAEKLLKATEKAGLSGLTFLGPETWHCEELIRLQTEYPGMRLTAAVESGDDESAADQRETDYRKAFLKAYRSRYGNETPPSETVRAFDAYMLAISAIEQAGCTDGQKVREALQQTENYSGVSGIITFNEDGEPKKAISIDVIEGGGFVPVCTVK